MTRIHRLPIVSSLLVGLLFSVLALAVPAKANAAVRAEAIGGYAPVAYVQVVNRWGFSVAVHINGTYMGALGPYQYTTFTIWAGYNKVATVAPDGSYRTMTLYAAPGGFYYFNP
jgi:hypothetical protein